MSKHKKDWRAAALHSLNWARKFRDAGDIEYFTKALDGFREFRTKSKEVA